MTLLNSGRNALTILVLVSGFALAGGHRAIAASGLLNLAPIPSQTVIEDQCTIALQVANTDGSTPAGVFSAGSSDSTVVPPGNVFFGDFAGHRYLTVTPAFGRTGTATITVTNTEAGASVTTSFVVVVNPPPTKSARFINTSPVIIPAQGTATPYPSSIIVEGRNGTITNMAMVLSKFSHSSVMNVNMMLVGPSNKGVVFFSHAVGDHPPGNALFSTVTVCLTDTSQYPLLPSFQLWPEPLRPAAYGSTVTFPGLPGGVEIASTPAFTNFNGLSANGTWSLYTYVDALSADAGLITDGWSLLIQTDGGGSSLPTISDIPNQITSVNIPTAAIPFTVYDPDTGGTNVLTLSKNTSNPTLVPLNNIVLGSSGGNRTVKVTPAASQTGTATITITVSDGVRSTNDTFVLTVTPPNVPPTITGIANQVINEDTPTAALSFTVGDATTAAGSLTVSAYASDSVLVPTNNIVFGGSGANRTVTMTPAINRFGTTTVTVIVSDGQDATSTNFTLTVNAVNDAPTIAAIANQTTLIDRSVGPFNIIIADAETGVGGLTLTGTSSDTNLVTTTNISFFTSGVQTLTVTPAAGQTGAVTITVTVSDGTTNTSTAFLLTVSHPSPGTAIFDNTNSITLPNTGSVTPYPSTNHVSGMPGAITKVTLTLKNLSIPTSQDLEMLLVGPENRRAVIFSKAGGGVANSVNVTLDDAASYALPPFNCCQILTGTYRPADNGHVDPFPSAPAGPYGATMSAFNGVSPNGDWLLYVIDDVAGNGAGTINGGWSLAITTDTPDTPPAISDINDQTTSVNTATAAIPFVIGDLETGASNLVLTASSLNTVLVPTGNIVFGGSGSNRTVTITPAPKKIGSATITVTVSDGVMATNDTFVVTVNPGELTVTGTTADNKVYDGTNTATIHTDGAAVVGLTGGDTVTLVTGAASGTFADKNVGNNKTVQVTGLTLSGSNAANYTLTQPTTSANITAASLTVTALNSNKVYGTALVLGGTAFSRSGTLYSGDTLTNVTLVSAGTLATATVGGYTVVPSAAQGVGLTNYLIGYSNGTLTVTTHALSVVASNATRVYGQTNPAFGGTINGLQNGDVITYGYSSAATTESQPGGYPIVPALINDPAGKLVNYTVGVTQGVLTILDVPRLLSIAEAPEGTFTLMWEVYSGRTYRFEYKNNLAETNWTTLDTVTAVSSSVTNLDNAGVNIHRIYRALDVPSP